ncbi:alpha/beta hydrolase [Cupriavidus alkaliphilus]|uniref:alpha/beta hydrolase n=1 Tax=Cupriavidus alkaliphilus TaxID=942866 RepID=UPI0017D85684|nr:alpha/beta hydrolase [Cupriavidus alkaliphilus]MBB2917076.1 acetyl esterase [Cupriavidus alkaliphilus]
MFADELRRTYRALIPSAGTPDPVAEIRTIAIPGEYPVREIPIRIYVPNGSAGVCGLPIVVFVHGGGWVSGDLDTHDVLVRAIANGAGALVLSVDYRLSPEHPFPAGLDDTYATLVWAVGNAAEIGGDADRIAVAGDSAGGNLVAALALLARDRGGPAIIAQWLMYPMLSNKMETHSWQRLGASNFPTRRETEQLLASYVPTGADASNPLVAPLRGRHENLPPALVQVAELDPLHDEGLAYADLLDQAGNEARSTSYPSSAHGFIQFFKDKATHPQGEHALKEGIDFLITRFGSLEKGKGK